MKLQSPNNRARKMPVQHLMILIIALAFLSPNSLQAQSPEYLPGELIVKTQNDLGFFLPEMRQEQDRVLIESTGFNELSTLFETYEVYHLERIFKNLGNEELDHTYWLKFKAKGNELELLDRLHALPWIEYVEVSPIYYPLYTPNDYTNASQMWYVDVIDLKGAWDVSKGNNDISIAVIDEGFLTTHPDLQANVWTNPGEIPANGIDDDKNGYIDDVHGWDGEGDNDPSAPLVNALSFNHGTTIAGAACAVTDNGIGVVGVGFNCHFIPVKARSDANTSGGYDRVVQATNYTIATKPDVMNMSYGQSTFYQFEKNLMIAAVNNGIIPVAGAGNSGSAAPFYPASHSEVINVGSVQGQDEVPWWSNYGTTIDVMAPSGIYTTTHDGNLNPGYSTYSGTSMSSPIVAGLIGLMLSANPCLTMIDVRAALHATSVNLDSIPYNRTIAGLIGAGRIDAKAAMDFIKPTLAPTATFTLDSTQLCQGVVACFYDGINQACPQNIRWTFDGKTSTEMNPVFSVSDTGTYSLTLVVNNNVGTNQVTIPVHINNILKVDAGGDDYGILTACAGQGIQMTGTATGSGLSYRWSPTNGINDPNSLTPILAGLNNRIYSLTVTDVNGCQVTDDVEVIMINSVDAGPDQTIIQGDTVQLDVTVVASGYTYAWSPTTGLSDPFIKNPKASPATTTTYEVTATTFSGCVRKDQVTVSALVGLDPISGEIGTINQPYPNPGTAEILLSADFAKDTDLKIKAYDLQGREIAKLFEGHVSHGYFSLPWRKNAAIAAGMYMVVWQTSGSYFTQKVQWK